MQVQASGTLGQRFRTTEQLDLVKDKHARILFLARREYPASSQDQRIGAVDAGAELRVNRVERVTEFAGILVVLPEYYTWDCAFAKIEDGPYAGKEVAVSGDGLLFKKDPATNGSAMLAPTAISNKSLQPTAIAP
jgi:hypothetical protein